jgi:hypothetical protein
MVLRENTYVKLLTQNQAMAAGDDTKDHDRAQDQQDAVKPYAAVNQISKSQAQSVGSIFWAAGNPRRIAVAAARR